MEKPVNQQAEAAVNLLPPQSNRVKPTLTTVSPPRESEASK